jgi:hypothetical protein
MARVALTFIVAAMFGAAQPPQPQMEQMQKLQSAMMDAQAKAARPGDETLSCEALQNELVSSVNDPAVQSTAARMGAWSEEKQREMAAASAAAKGKMAAQMAMGFASSLATMFVPGLSAITGRAQAAAAQAQAAQGAAAAAQNLQQITEMSNAMIPILPQLMRGQHVIGLASAKKCEWVPPPSGP